MSQQAVKFTYWVPNVSGGLVVSKIEQRTDWGIDYNRKLAQIAEAAGFEYALCHCPRYRGRGAGGIGADHRSGRSGSGERVWRCGETSGLGKRVLPLVRELEAEKTAAVA